MHDYVTYFHPNSLLYRIDVRLQGESERDKKTGVLRIALMIFLSSVFWYSHEGILCFRD